MISRIPFVVISRFVPIRRLVYLLNDERKKCRYGEKYGKYDCRVESEFLKTSSGMKTGTEAVSHAAAESRRGLLQQNADG